MFIIGLILFFIHLSSTEAGGTCEIKFVRYSNPGYKDYAGQCCETTSSTGCSPNECDPFIDICICDVPKTRDCSHGKTTTRTFDNTDVIVFQDKIGSLSNPVRFRFNKWLNGLSFTIRVMDKDSFFSDDLIDDFMYQLTDIIPKSNGTEILQPHRVRGKRVVMDIEYMVNCDVNYYGDCTTYCKPNMHHYCDPVQGRKICYQGWTGSDCETNVDECQSSPCRNGGQCLDGINNYVCNCTDNYTGRHCEIKNDTSMTTNEKKSNQTQGYNHSSTSGVTYMTTTESASTNVQGSSTTLIYTDNYENNSKFGTKDTDVSTTEKSSTVSFYQTSFLMNSEKTNIDITLYGQSFTGNNFVKETSEGTIMFGGKTSSSTSSHGDSSTTDYHSTDEVTEHYMSNNQDLLSSTKLVPDPNETDSPISTPLNVLSTTEGKTSLSTSIITSMSQEPSSTDVIDDKSTSIYQTTDNVFSLHRSRDYFTNDKSKPTIDTTTSPSLVTQRNNVATFTTLWKSISSGYNNMESQSVTNTINSNKRNTLSYSEYNTKQQTKEQTKTMAANTTTATTISANTTTIPANTTTISANTTTIPADTTTISANTTTISANTTTISANTTTISGNTTTTSVPKSPEITGQWFSSYTDGNSNKETSTNSNIKLSSTTGEISSIVNTVASMPVLETTTETTDVQTTKTKCDYNIVHNKKDTELRVVNLKQQLKKDDIKEMTIDILATKKVKTKNDDIKISLYGTRSVIILFSNLESVIDGGTLSKLGETLCGTRTAEVRKLQTTSGDSSGSIVGAVVGLLYFGTLMVIAFILVRRKYRERNKVEDSCSDLENVVDKNIMKTITKPETIQNKVC